MTVEPTSYIIYYLLHQPEGASLTEHWNYFLKAQVKHQLTVFKVSTLKDCTAIFQNVGYALNEGPLMILLNNMWV